VLRGSYSWEADAWSIGVMLYIMLCGMPVRIFMVNGMPQRHLEPLGRGATRCCLTSLSHHAMLMLPLHRGLSIRGCGAHVLQPFWGRTDGEIFKRVLNEPLDLDIDPWPEISKPAKDLVAR
jgi:serine/threonine protein kinase